MEQSQLNLALVGYGKMGRMIESLASEYGCRVAVRLDADGNQGGAGITAAALQGVDVAIEFTAPEAVVPNVQALAEAGVSMVVGTTGWTERLEEVRAVVEVNEVGLVWSPNFSVGVQAFFRLVREAARLMCALPEYESWAHEMHHSAKLDAPSGTMLKLVEEMRRSGYTLPIDVSSSRAGKVPGIHEIGFDSAADTITLCHTARNREGFARGALQAARWIAGKRGLYEFDPFTAE
jgi:4-hydroxy-tetrahydrodipicolinate reductase